MILEHALLQVSGEREVEFEESFRAAAPIISSMPGFRSLRLERCIEDRSRYLLLVQWEHLEDHTEGFRQSPAYQQWKALLHHFYDPFPTVEHYELVLAR